MIVEGLLNRTLSLPLPRHQVRISPIEHRALHNLLDDPLLRRRPGDGVHDVQDPARQTGESSGGGGRGLNSAVHHDAIPRSCTLLHESNVRDDNNALISRARDRLTLPLKTFFFSLHIPVSSCSPFSNMMIRICATHTVV